MIFDGAEPLLRRSEVAKQEHWVGLNLAFFHQRAEGSRAGQEYSQPARDLARTVSPPRGPRLAPRARSSFAIPSRGEEAGVEIESPWTARKLARMRAYPTARRRESAQNLWPSQEPHKALPLARPSAPVKEDTIWVVSKVADLRN